MSLLSPLLIPSLQKSDHPSLQEKRYKFLCEQTDLFEHFINVKKDGKSAFAALLEQVKAGESAEKKTSHASSSADHRHAHRKSEREEDADLLAEGEELTEALDGADSAVITHFSESPPYVKGGTMRPYQIEGLNWMISLFENGINGILIDNLIF